MCLGAGVQAASLSFEKDIRPIFKTSCFQCHGEEKEIKGDLDVRLKHLLVKGGESGPAVVPGKPEESLLVEQLKKGKMPKGKKKLKPEDVAKIEQWIAEGAKTLRAEPDHLEPGPVISEEDRNYWAFQPIRHPAAPANASENPIDAFLKAKLTKAGLTLSHEADRVTLIRRATFDLTGLPPTPEETAAFVSDPRPDAWEHLIDRLLESPRYGECWGRHWLDVAGYADSEGYNDDDTNRPEAWRYRDYVIASFNRNKPFDVFIREQIAGDEMIPNPCVNLKPDQVEKLTATGFLRMAPDGSGTERMDPDLAKNAVVTETVKIVSSSLLGMTIGCAECHDHRFDPILQRDFYRMRAIFEPALNWKAWRSPTARNISLLTTEERKKSDELEKEARAVQAELQAVYIKYRDMVFNLEVSELPEDVREKCREAGLAFQKDPTKLTPEQKQLTEDYPAIKVTPSSGILNLYLEKRKMAEELKKIEDDNAKRAAAIRAKKPKEELVRALAEPAAYGNQAAIPVTRIFLRGNRESPGDEVVPGDMTIINPDHPINFPVKNPKLPTTGRRLAFAQHLTDGKHPLVARVLVNRFWMHHFGRGLVNTPGDFGLQGEKPTHPELLDWLASEFMQEGWNLKKLHKLIMNSAAYRQASEKSTLGETRDPGDTLLWHYPLRRLEAETIRDATLAVCGNLNPQPNGPPVPIHVDENNQTCVGAEKPTMDGQEFRRSVYVTQKRSLPAQVLAVFDAPDMSPNCEIRNCSTVAPQSLLMMNSQFVIDEAVRLAKRVVTEAGNDPAAQVSRAWECCFGVRPESKDQAELVAYLAQQKKLIPAGKGMTPESVSLQALASLCQTLLQSNRFLYVD